MAITGIVTMDMSVVTAMHSAARTAFLFSITATADVTTAAGKAAPKIRHTFTVSATGSQFTSRKMISGRSSIFRNDIRTRVLFLTMCSMSVSPNCIPTTSIERGTVTSPIVLTVSKSISGRCHPQTSITRPTTDIIIEGFADFLITVLISNFAPE